MTWSFPMSVDMAVGLVVSSVGKTIGRTNSRRNVSQKLDRFQTCRWLLPSRAMRHGFGRVNLAFHFFPRSKYEWQVPNQWNHMTMIQIRFDEITLLNIGYSGKCKSISSLLIISIDVKSYTWEADRLKPPETTLFVQQLVQGNNIENSALCEWGPFHDVITRLLYSRAVTMRCR